MSWKSQPASPEQRGFIKTLVADRQVPEVFAAIVTTALEGALTKGEASTFIDALKAYPFKQKAQATAKSVPAIPDVPAGRYALVSGDETLFFQVDRPTQGKWAGYTFLSRLTGDNHEPIRRRNEPELFTAVLTDIARDPQEAVRRYGHHRNECGYCHKNLTTQFSRFFGVGPKCARDHGMPFSFASYIKAYPHEDAAVAAWLHEDGQINEPTSEEANAEWAEWKNLHAQLEAQQETAAFMAGI